MFSATAAADMSPAAEAGVKSGVPKGPDAAAANASGAQNSRGIRATMGHMVSTVRLLQPGVAAVWKRVFVVDMLVTVQVRLTAIFNYEVMCVDSNRTQASITLHTNACPWCRCLAGLLL